jgi:hypothetical protein
MRYTSTSQNETHRSPLNRADLLQIENNHRQAQYLVPKKLAWKLMRGQAPIVARAPRLLASPFTLFPPRIDWDWPEILARIPIGYGLAVPLSRATATMAISRLTSKRRLKRYEYIVNRSGRGQCIIYHVKVFLGEPFRIRPASRRRRFPSKRWDEILKRVMSGETVTVNAPYMVVYQAIYRRLFATHTPASSITFEKIRENGKERTRLRRK